MIQLCNMCERSAFMKRIILSTFSFLFFIAFATGLFYMILKIIEHPTRNFAILWILPFSISSIDYFYLAISFVTNKLSENKIIAVLLIAVVQALLPTALFCLMLSPKILLTLDLLSSILLYLPIMLLILPIYVLFDIKKSNKKN